MSRQAVVIFFLSALSVLPGCATYNRHGLDPQLAQQVKQEFTLRQPMLTREAADEILALDPAHVTDHEVRKLLSQAPAPRIINIHGGIYPVHRRMLSFTDFLIGMGYPGSSITNPGDGTYSFSCYESSEKIAGAIAWYYECEGLRPMIVGHSQGGMQAVKVLRKLAGLSSKRLHIWNPLTWKKEERFNIIDPRTGKMSPIVGLQLPYVTAVGAGGLTRILPNQWDMCMKLRKVPDSVEEFTGFYKGKDLLGGDFLGYGRANDFRPIGKAVVRNVRLPSAYKHGAIPDTRHLLKSEQIKNWINDYRPVDKPLDTTQSDLKFDSDSSHILWAADVWYSIKKYWVIELQRLIRAERLMSHGG
jgi:pimeloyl-ACP methyl ester carboxylesterase